ncbi:uncharacterized protein LOC131425313 [Malaya genurostris]|uniref:uncharacterized protein LOC131425313 n=1 Tax=Malaya genurostris TaxID=325434 RepID=UPI0026F3923F|nr:uncharacterized protein LOC131425313 [Malaya genurostris]XP_058443090.1 uncharacterized protein LOC131425313 [Malaya genurostris]
MRCWFDPWILLWVVPLLVEECRQVVALRLTDINVPEIVDYRATVTLSCSYDLGPHQLNSVKWYKGNQEFYRYAPMLNPKTKTFPVEGVVIAHENLCNQYLCQIRLTSLERRSSGDYRCEISGDAPKFALANGSRNMTVEVLPQHDPIISGLAATYYPGETIEANCTSDMSSLGTRLYFFVNEKAVPIEYLLPAQETSLESDNFVLRYRILEMHLPVDRLFPKGVDRTILHVKCIDAIDAVRTAGRETTTRVAVQSHRWSWIIGGMSSGGGGSGGSLSRIPFLARIEFAPLLLMLITKLFILPPAPFLAHC